MDLQKELIESSHKRGAKSWRTYAASLAVHGLLIGSIVYAGSHQLIHKVDAEEKIDAFISGGAAPPPPPPPPRAKSSGAPRSTPQSQPKPVEIPRTPQLIPPTEIEPLEMPTPTHSLPVVPDSEPSLGEIAGGVEEGVVGGVEGGVEGGVVGGVNGGVIGGVTGGVVGGVIGGTGTGTEGAGTGSGPPAEAAPPPPPPPPPPEPEPSGPLRVGGDVKAPVATQRVEPDYTEAAKKAKATGTVVVEAVITKTGSVRDVRVIKGLGFGLSTEAEQAVKKWRFRPGTLNGQPVDVIFNLTVTFQLNQ